MRALLRLFNVLSWPFWAKLLAGFTLAVVIPVMLVVGVTQSGYNEINSQNMSLFVAENGARQQQAITVALGQASAEMENFANNLSHSRQMLLVLKTPVINPQNRVTAALFQVNLFDTGLLRSVRLLNLEGTIVAHADPANIFPAGVSNLESLAFIRGADAYRQGRSGSITILRDGTMEITRAIVDSGAVFGYLIGTLDVERAVLQSLGLSGNIYNAYSYLVAGADNSIVLTLEDMRASAESAAVESVAVVRALGGLSQASTYRVGENRDQVVIGFYAPIFDPTHAEGPPLFALVAEASAHVSLAQSLAHLGGARAFIVAIGGGLILVLLVLLFNQVITPPVNQLRLAIQAMSRGEFNLPVGDPARADEIGQLSRAFVDMRDQMRTLLDDLETRIAARTRDISATQAVSRFAATQRDLQTLLDEVVNLIIQHFPSIYHAQIFLVDEDRQYAVLRASTGEVGQMLLKRGHRLAVGSISVIGQVTHQGEVVVARDTAASQVHRRNEFLPDTRAELAIPLRIGSQLIGALDVQSRQRNAFIPDEVMVLQTMADQIAIAIENARLYQDSMRRMAEIERANREATRATWQEYIYSLRQRALFSEAGIATGADLSDLRRQAILEGRVIVGELTAHNTVPIAVPIQLSGQTLGAVEWELPAEHLDDNKLQLARELANRLAVSLDNARLFEESQRAAERERVVNTIAARLTPQTEIHEILQTAVREVGQALRAPQVSIRLHQANGKDDHKSDKR